MNNFTDNRNRCRSVDEAAEWFVLLQNDELDNDNKQAFAEWLMSSTEHVRGFLKLAMLSDDIASLKSATLPSADELRAAVFADAPQAEIVSLFDRAESSGSRFGTASNSSLVEINSGVESHKKGRRRVFRGYRLAAAAAIAIVAVGVTLFFQNSPPLDSFKTIVGEQSSMTLEDGSMVILNTQTEVQLDYSSEFRDLHLVSGEALFEVAKDPNRPFRVFINGALVKAVGTKFNIRRYPSRTEATLLEGLVDVSLMDQEGEGDIVRLQPADQAKINHDIGQIEVVEVDLTKTVAWRQRKLIFDGESLKNAVDEYNRYNSSKIVMLGSELDAVSVSGVFSAFDPASFTLFLQEAGLARVRVNDSTIILSDVRE